VHEPDLTIPHPEIANREFWQRELAQIDTLAPETHD
jgi:7,8-dihydro-6-hydroxymethylpterin-pyrophosphokinase